MTKNVNEHPQVVVDEMCSSLESLGNYKGVALSAVKTVEVCKGTVLFSFF